MHIRRGMPRPFRCDVTEATHKGFAAAGGYEADIRQLPVAVDAQDVFRLHIAMDEVFGMQTAQRLRRLQPNPHHLIHRQAAIRLGVQISAQGHWLVIGRHLISHVQVIRQIHYIIIKAILLTDTHVMHLNETIVFA